MTTSFADALKWPEYVQEFMDMGSKGYHSDQKISQKIKDLTKISEWEGLSGNAARDALRRDHQTLDMDSEASRQLLAKAIKVHNETLDVAKGIRSIVEFAGQDPRILIDLDTNQVYPPSTGHLNPNNEKDAAEIKRIQDKYKLLQQRVKTAEQAIGIVDQDFSRVMQYATGAPVDKLPEWRQPPRIHAAKTMSAAAKGFAPRPGDEDFPIPKQTLKENDETKGTPFGSGIAKDQTGKATTRSGGTPAKVAKPGGPKIWGDETEKFERQKGWAEGEYGKVNIGGRDVDFRWGSRGPNLDGQAGLEAYQKGVDGKAGGSVNLFTNDFEARSSAGPVDLALTGEQRLGVDAHMDTTLNVDKNGGVQGGGDMFAGYSETRSINANAWGLQVQNDTTGYAGAGAGLSGHVGRTDDGKWALGWNAGLAFGAGGKNHMEITIDPSEVKEHLDDAWKWLSR